MIFLILTLVGSTWCFVTTYNMWRKSSHSANSLKDMRNFTIIGGILFISLITIGNVLNTVTSDEKITFLGTFLIPTFIFALLISFTMATNVVIKLTRTNPLI